MKENKKVINAWCVYDWAVSVYNLVITSAIFPIYYSKVAVNEQGGDLVSFLGVQIKNTVLYSYSLSFAFFLVAIFSPFLTAISDFSGRKKLFMQFFCYLGGMACCFLYFFDSSTLTFSIFMFVLACIGYSGSFIFYNSYLPEITSEENFDKVSARGFSYGYVGSVILLIFNLLMIMKPEFFGNISSQLASQLSFFSVGVWWIGFAQYTFYHLPKDHKIKKSKDKEWIFNGFKKLKEIFHKLSEFKNAKRFLISFFFYNMAVQTVMLIATVFAEKELHLPTASLIITVLILQLIAIFGATLFARISDKYGNIKSIAAMIIIWIFICLAAYFVTNGIEFYILASFVGLVMGGIQSLSRATYTKLLPESERGNASYFSFYESINSLSIIFGTFFYGITEAITGSPRYSILILGVFFIFGLIFIRKVRVSS